MKADRIALLVAAREGEPSAFVGAGFPERLITGIDTASASMLIASSSDVRGHLHRRSCGTLYEATGGNPLALIELPSLLDPAQLAGRASLDEPLRPGRAIERSFARRLERLPSETRRALTVVAASRTRDPAPILAALLDRGLSPDALDSAELAGLISSGAGRLCIQPSTAPLRRVLQRADVRANRRPRRTGRTRGAVARCVASRRGNHRDPTRTLRACSNRPRRTPASEPATRPPRPHSNAPDTSPDPGTRAATTRGGSRIRGGWRVRSCRNGAHRCTRSDLGRARAGTDPARACRSRQLARRDRLRSRSGRRRAARTALVSSELALS